MGVSLPKWVVITNVWAVIKAKLGSELATVKINYYKVSSTVIMINEGNL